MSENISNDKETKKIFVEREFKETEDGKYDRDGFYRLPDGCYWDPDGIYFNEEGFDKHGGYYDNNLEYHPGKGWVDDLMCYEDEVVKQIKEEGGLIEDCEDFGEPEDDYNEYDDLYDNIDSEILGEAPRNHKQNYQQRNNNQYNQFGTGPYNNNYNGGPYGNQFNNQYNQYGGQYNNQNFYPKHPNSGESKIVQVNMNNKNFYDYQNEQNPYNQFLKHSTPQNNQQSEIPKQQQEKSQKDIKTKEQEDFEKEYPNLNLKDKIPQNPNIQVFNKIPDNFGEKHKSEEEKGKRQETKIEVDSLFS